MNRLRRATEKLETARALLQEIANLADKAPVDLRYDMEAVFRRARKQGLVVRAPVGPDELTYIQQVGFYNLYRWSFYSLWENTSQPAEKRWTISDHNGGWYDGAYPTPETAVAAARIQYPDEERDI